MKKENLDKLVEDTLNSLDGSARATPAPFLLTRIRARMTNQRAPLSLWERAGIFLTKPVAAFGLVALVLVMNFYIIASSFSNNSNGFATQNTLLNTDEYSLNSTSSLYDFENNQP